MAMLNNQMVYIYIYYKMAFTGKENGFCSQKKMEVS